MFANKGQIIVHSRREFEGMRQAGRLAAETLDFITPYVKPGISTGELNRLCHDFQVERGAKPAPLGYRGFPKSICTSLNDVICHGIPDDEAILKEGDILNIDVTPIVKGWHGDTSRMFFVGDVSEEARKLVDVTYRCMWAGIEAVKPGAKTGDIGHAIQQIAEGEGYSVVRDFCGHGVGRTFHMDPQISHYGTPGTGVTLRKGMFFTIEPMINIGDWRMEILDDDWTSMTQDGSLSAQFEHSLAVTDDGFEVFTSSPTGLDCPPY